MVRQVAPSASTSSTITGRTRPTLAASLASEIACALAMKRSNRSAFTSAATRSNALPDHVPAEVKAERFGRFMAKAQAISEAKLAAKVGRTMPVIVDEVDEDGATCRTMADAPEIDGNLFIDAGFQGLAPGDIVQVQVDEAGEYDLWGTLV